MMNNKERAISFLRLASSGNVREAYNTYIHPDFRHHNPYFPGDRAALLSGLEEGCARHRHLDSGKPSPLPAPATTHPGHH